MRAPRNEDGVALISKRPLVGFETRDIRAAVDRLRSMGYRMVTREEPVASYPQERSVAAATGGFFARVVR